MPAHEPLSLVRYCPWAAVVRSTWLAAGLMLVGCGPQIQPLFMQKQHRELYAINEQDLARLQFYVSTKVVAHDLDAPGAQGVVLVDAGTPGIAIGAGPRWIRVRFQKGGQGVVFLADPAARGDTGYALATESDGADGYRLVRDVPDHVLRVGDRRYRIVEGANAHLRVDDKTLQKLVAGRRHVEGQRVPEP